METKGSKKIDHKYKLELMHDDKNTQPWINLYFEPEERMKASNFEMKAPFVQLKGAPRCRVNVDLFASQRNYN